MDLHLDRTMLPAALADYVDRFACDWHRLATTDPKFSTTSIISCKNRKRKFFLCKNKEYREKTIDSSH